MINAITLLKRRPDLSVDAFQRYWQYEHAEIIARLPGIQRYVQSRALRENYQGREPAYDGIAELWANDSQAFREIAASEVYAEVQADEVKFLDRTSIALVLTDEHVIKDGTIADDHVKCIQLFKRRQKLPVDEFQNYWHNIYGPLLAELPLVDRYVQCHARSGGYAQGRAPAYDGFDVTWFKSSDALHDALNSKAYDPIRSEQKNILAKGECPQILTREVVIKD